MNNWTKADVAMERYVKTSRYVAAVKCLAVFDAWVADGCLSPLPPPKPAPAPKPAVLN